MESSCSSLFSVLTLETYEATHDRSKEEKKKKRRRAVRIQLALRASQGLTAAKSERSAQAQCRNYGDIRGPQAISAPVKVALPRYDSAS